MKSVLTTLALASALLTAKTIPVYDLVGSLSESGQATTDLLSFDFSAERPLTQFDIIKSLQSAATDEDVPGIVLEVDQAGFSYAQLQEISRHLEAIRKAGKDVWIYTENLNAKTAQLGAHANHLVLMPEGGVSLNGLYSETMYFKGLLDRVGVTAHVVHIGDFKSFGEAYYRTGPSEPARKQNEELYDALFSQMKSGIAQGRKIKPGKLSKLIDKGFITPEQALNNKLVDSLQYRTDFIATIRAHYGEDAEYDRSYELPNLSGPEIEGFMDIFSLMFSDGKSRRLRDPYLAVVVLEGGITDASVAPVRTAILNAKKDDLCKGLVFRIDSPGGSALASEVLWEATEEFKSTNKPFIVSMGGVAASGGYYVAAGADRIFAENGTITGSIGVVGMKLAFGPAMNSIGITTHEYKRGAHADLYNTNRPFTPEEESLVRNSMLDVYGTFKKRIMDGRGDKLTDDLEKLAGGRVYSGHHALKHGLIDEIGGLAEAIAFATSQTKEESLKTHLRPEPINALDGLFSSPATPDEDGEFISVNGPPHPLIDLRTQLKTMPALRLFPESKQRAIQSALEELQSIHSDHILLVAPPLPLLR